MTHTPTPWRFTDDGRATTVRADDAACPKPIAEIWDNGDSREANAAFIVTAVNAYDKQRALIETLSGAARQFMEVFVADDGEPFLTVEGIEPNEMAQRYDALAVALAAAKEQSA